VIRGLVWGQSDGIQTTRRVGVLAAYAAATVLLIPFDRHPAGFAAWLAAVLAVWLPGKGRSTEGSSPLPSNEAGERPFRRRMSVLLGCVMVLAWAPIHTATDNLHFLVLGSCFLAVVLVPTLLLKRSDPGVIAWRILPQRLRIRDLVYVVISIPLSWLIFKVYFFHLSPEVPGHWPLPQPASREAVTRLAIGINLVGIWDELFFVNTAYGLLRSLYHKRLANLGAAVIYTSVLYKMAFTGWGPLFVGALAITQGAMYEGSRALIWVILVHLIIDLFLLAAILDYHYPGTGLTLF